MADLHELALALPQSALVRIPKLARLERDELEDLIAEAWLTRAQKRVAKTWLSEHAYD